jgi:hypothetical protein
MVERILDTIGWGANVDLSEFRLLEPAAGDGVFVIEAVRRLVASFAQHRVPLSRETLAPRIRAFELHATEAEIGRSRLAEMLAAAGLEQRVARQIACDWLLTADFLLTPLEHASFTHAAGNPPYARWSKIPKSLRLSYEAELPKRIAKGDLFLPFLDRCIEALVPTGRLGLLCSNRWQYMAFATDFRNERLPQVRIIENDVVAADKVYQRSADIYPSVLVLERRAQSVQPAAVKRRGKTLQEAGFAVRVGPALGCTQAYVLGAEETDVEAELLAPWLTAAEVGDAKIQWLGKRIICLYDASGRLRDPLAFPLAHARLLHFKSQLQERAIVRQQKAPWYRPIDRVFAAAWSAPKLLIPELAKTPRVAFDASGAVPSHGVYAIVTARPDADLAALYSQLEDGGLSRALQGRAPRVKGGYVRCYKRFLEAIEV